MSTKSTQRFVGVFVAGVATLLLLIAFPTKSDGPRPRGDEASGREARAGTVDPRDALPVYELEDGWWKLIRYGMRMRLPEGWVPAVRRDRPFAFRDEAAPFEGSLNVLSIPNFFHTDLASLKRENEKSLETDESMELIGFEDLELPGGKPAVRMDYTGRPVGPTMRFSAVIFFLGGHQVVVTAGAVEEQWEAVGPILLESLATIELLDLPTISVEELYEEVGVEPVGRD